jgi:hypothetical protein
MGNNYAIVKQAEALEALGCEVHFMWVQERPLKKAADTATQKIVEACTQYWGDRFYHCRVSLFYKMVSIFRREFSKRFRKGYFNIDTWYHRCIVNYINRVNQKEHFDACIVNYFDLSRVLAEVDIPKKAIHTHDNHIYNNIKYAGDVTLAQNGGVGADIFKGMPPNRTLSPNDEARALQRAPHIFSLQDEETAIFQCLAPQSHVYTIYSLFPYHKTPIVGNHNMLVLAAKTLFNISGIIWFIEKILPEIVKQIPDAKLLLAGNACKVIEKKYPKHPAIEYVGYVESVEDFFAKGDVAVNPIYQGTGLKIKTFDSLANDKVLIAHPHSKKGIFDKENAPIFASEDPKEWVEFLKKVWGSQDEIVAIKRKNEEYLSRMNDYVLSEYRRFLEAK